ncbi:MAG: hypothetical protein JNM17_36360 [Archangium sp.]|nr:hypothetical protein [Archangium sp.]
MRVLTATSHGESAAWEELWSSMLASLAAEAEDGEQSFLAGGHNLEIERAGDVARIIERLTSR